MHFQLLFGLAALSFSGSCVDASPIASTETQLDATPIWTPSGTQCDFYSCLESKKHCGPSGYPIGYGLKYCQLFEQDKDRFSAEGQAWIVRTRLCLQQALVPDSDSSTVTCDQINTDAFDSHPRCYVQSGLCKLPPSDFVALSTVIEPQDMLNAPAINNEVLTVEGCATLCASTPGCPA